MPAVDRKIADPVHFASKHAKVWNIFYFSATYEFTLKFGHNLTGRMSERFGENES